MADPSKLEFHEFVKEHEYGMLNQQAQTAIREAIIAANRHGAKAVVTIKLTIDPHDEFVGIAASVDSKLPQPPATVKTYFVDHTGAYSRENLTKTPQTTIEFDQETGEILNQHEGTE